MEYNRKIWKIIIKYIVMIGDESDSLKGHDIRLRDNVFICYHSFCWILNFRLLLNYYFGLTSIVLQLQNI